MNATVRALAPQSVPVPVPSLSATAASQQEWQIIGGDGHPAAPYLRGGKAGADGGNRATVVLLGAEYHAEDNAHLLRGIASARRDQRRLVLIHLGAGGVSLLRAAMAEDPGLRGLAIELPEVLSAPAMRTALALAGSEWSSMEEMIVDAYGRVGCVRWVPVDLPPPPARGSGSGAVVITGGLGGLGIRVAGALSHLHRLHPVLVDRRTPDDLTPAARRHLSRLATSPIGVSVRAADITDERQASAALSALRRPVTTVVHCAGVLRGGPVSGYTAGELTTVQTVKVVGLRNVLAAIDPSRLDNLVVFGSMLAEREPHGLGCYALANELLRRATLRMSARLPSTATVVAQWSIWAGAGMAHELGVVRQARRMGLRPIALRSGMAALHRMLAVPAGPEHARSLMLMGA